jgi:DNA-binding SARP family transcriptional activator/WD40 repeat protein/tRNA A-37 threonylcarbamoyl transferase component Bud32
VSTDGKSLLYVSAMEFRVLGPIEVVADGERLDLGGPKQRTLLALLVANAGKPMSTEALIDGAYGDEPPDGARRSVQTYISNLRSLIGDMIKSVPSGYEFRQVDSWIDAEQFSLLTETGHSLIDKDPGAAGTKLREALALWRGHPYSDIEARGYLDSEVTRLNELRLAALESRIDADLAAGQDRELVGELEALTTEHPFREAFHSQHMLALYRSGRQAEALRAYTSMRENLAEELGVDPSPVLRELEQRILEQDPSLALPSASEVRRRAVLVIDLANGDGLGPDRRREALIEIDRVVGTAISGADGVLAAQQGTATYGTFSDVRSAVEAATVIGHNAPHADGQPMLRMALDVGQVEEEPTGAIAGPAVIRAAGLIAIGHSGQVLLSSAAQTELAEDSVGGSLVRGLGRHPVARLENPETIHQLVIDGLPTNFPPLRTGAEPPGLPSTGAAVPGYELREAIGHGIFGTVYRGYQPSVGREVAIKVINPELANSASFIRRFAVEAQMISRIEHPNVVPLYDFWRGPDSALLIMRLMRGGNLADWLAANEMTRDFALRLIDQIGGALATAHDLGIAHGDVQPANVLLNESEDLFLSDFGIADSGSAPGDHMTQQLDVAAFASMVVNAAAGVSLGSHESEVLQAARQGAYATAGDMLDIWRIAVGAAAESMTYTPTRNPYKGLAAFSELDAKDFHGRDLVVQDLVTAIGEQRLVAVAGPSGIGKSSVVRAGLLPVLRSHPVAESDTWLVADCLPGTHPFERLTAAIMRVASTFPQDLDELLRRSDRGLVQAVDRYLPAGSELLLVIDQFEELFTLCSDEESRQRFLQMLVTTVNDTASKVRVLLTIRADFMDRPLRHPAFGEVFRRGSVLVSAPTEDELREIIVQPAAGVGVDFEAGAVERMVNEVRGEAGALPLLEFALTELFEDRDSDLMTLAAYEQAGGVTASLGRRAEESFSGLTTEQRHVARQVFLRLVSPDEAGRDTRQRVRISDLNLVGLAPHAVEAVLDAFGSHRLLTFDHDEVTRGATVEVAHEALLREWPRLTDWIEEHREELLLRGRLSAAAGDWIASDRSATYLLSGGRLSQHEVWTEATSLPLSQAERELLEGSRSAENSRLAKRRRTRRLIMGGLGTAAAIAVVLAGVAINASRQATESEQEAIAQAQDAEAARADSLQSATLAEQNASLAEARELVLAAEQATIDDPELGVHLALESIDRFEDAGDVPATAVAALRGGIASNRVVGRMPVSLFAAPSPDGTTIAVESGDANVELRDARTLEVVDTIVFDDSRALFARYSDTGDELFVAVVNTDVFRAFLWAVDLDTGTRELLPGPSDGYPIDVNIDMRLNGNGDVVERQEEALTVWSRATGTVTFQDTVAFGSGFNWASDGRVLYATLDDTGNPLLHVVDGFSGDEIATIQSSFVPVNAEFSPNGRRVALTESSGWVSVVDLDTNGLAWPALKLSRAGRPVWSADGTDLLVGGDRPLAVIDAANGTDVRYIPAGSGGSDFYQYLPGTDNVVMTTVGAETLVLNVAERSPEALINLYSPIHALGMRVADGGGQVVARGEFPGFVVIDTQTGDTATHVEVQDASPVTADIGLSIITADGRYSSALDTDLLYKVWPTAGGPPIYTADRDWFIVGLNADASQAVLKQDQNPLARIVDTGTGQTIAEMQVGLWLTYAEFSPDNRYVLGSTEETPDQLRVYDASDGTLVAQFGGEPREFAGLWFKFAPSGDTVVVATQRGDVFVYDFAMILDGAETEAAIIRTIPAHNSFVFEPAISPDSSLLATVSQSEPARVWDLATGRLLAEVGSDDTTAVAFHPTEPWLLISSGGDTITAHTLDVNELVELGRSSLTREMTDEECELYLHGSCESG